MEQDVAARESSKVTNTNTNSKLQVREMTLDCLASLINDVTQIWRRYDTPHPSSLHTYVTSFRNVSLPVSLPRQKASVASVCARCRFHSGDNSIKRFDFGIFSPKSELTRYLDTDNWDKTIYNIIKIRGRLAQKAKR